MKEPSGAKAELIAEISDLKQKIQHLEKFETKRRQADGAIQQSDENYRLMFENAVEGILVAQEGIIKFTNPALENILGYPKGIITTKPFTSFIHPEDSAMAADRHARRLRGEQVETGYEFRIITADGTVRWVNIFSQLLSWERVPATLNFVTDITERKRAEFQREAALEELQESEGKFSNLVEQSPLSIQILDASGKTIKVNRAFEDLWGTAFEQMGDYNIFEDDQFKDIGIRSYLEKAFSGESVEFPPVEFTPRTKSVVGHKRMVQAIAYPVRDKAGNIRQVTMIHQDITSRKQAEDELRESEERYRNLFENAHEAIFVAQDGNLVFLNQRTATQIGYTIEDLKSKSFIEFIHPDDQGMVIDNHIKRMRGEKIPNVYTFRVIHKDGSVRLTELNAVEIKWKGKPATLNFQTDITDRMRVEEELRLSEERFRLLVKNSSDIMGIVNPDGQQRYVSDAAESITGFPASELASKNIAEVIHPDDLLKVLEAFESCLATPDKFLRVEYRHIHKTKGWVYFEAIAQSFIDDPSIRGVVTNVRDITERRQTEEEKKLLEERLQQADKMEAIGTLAGGIAHDFNNLLAGIQGYVSMTLMNLNQNDPNYERLKRIEDQVRSGADLTSQLLGFARGGRYEVKPSDMNEILKKTSSMFGRTKKEISIQRKVVKDLWSVEVDRGQMEQVFMNLYVNAWQAMPEGGHIYLETQNAFLNGEQALFYSVKPGKHVKIAVTDTGIGMDEKTREKIFEPFFTTKAMGRGTGLGLATVYGIIKGHGGMINVYSEPDHGTTFTIYLPASEKQVVQEETLNDEIVPGTETILLIDDEKTVMEVNKELLESVGYTVCAAGSGQEGIAAYMEKKDKIDLIILDMVMPGISGSDTFDRLREINPNAKVLLSSGYSLTGKAKAIMDRGCNGFLQKPFRLEELSSKVREIFG